MQPTETERNTTFFRFEDLRIYHKSQDYIKWVHEATEKFDDNKDNLSLKFNEVARSIAVNIAEGSARNKSQFIYYLKMAKSAVRECLVYTTSLYESGVLSSEENDISRNYLMEMTKMIGALISSLQRGHGGGRDRDYHHDHHDNDDYHPQQEINENNY
jgi:four helix bundle protein